MSKLGNILAAVISLLDYVPLKGYRTVVFCGLLTVIAALEAFGKIPADVSAVVVPLLAGGAGFYASQHLPTK